MEKQFRVALSVLTGMLIGGATVQVLHAQDAQPVFMIALNEVTNADGYKTDYLPKSQATIKANGGVYVAAGAGTSIEGSLPAARVAVIKWDSMDVFKKWYDSPDFQAARKVGQQYAKFNLVVVPAAKPQ